MKGLDTSRFNSRENLYTSAIILEIKKIIARYGLDADEWSLALSGQYFLVSLAHMLGMENQSDYVNLFNKFLSSFQIQHKDKMQLDNQNIMITPSETKRIAECMQEEDMTDSTYANIARLRAENIDTQQMHTNYLYGLVLQISSLEDSIYANAIKEICIENLFNKASLDPYGGWYPYRIPWITARLLISLKSIDKNPEIESIITEALESLINRIADNKWRSGVGTWVSDIESTALCLEALFVWDYVVNNKNVIERIILDMYSVANEFWEKDLDFSTEEKYNDSLALIVLASVVYRIIDNHFTDRQNILREVEDFFKRSIIVVSENNNPTFRQFCTIPQILYYITSALI